MEKDISPAMYETPSTQMSSQEFQRMLYTWFEEKGLVADLRSYLRLLMINKLRNTTVGKIDCNKTNFSLPKQALCLIIAEHLLRECCHYTLSIYSTEVPGVATHLPFSLFEAHCSKDSENFRFDQDSVLNVLELIGISKNSNENLRIAGLYFRNYGSLLSCLISSKAVDKSLDITVDEKTEDVGNYLDRVFSTMGIPTDVTDKVRKKIHQTVVQEKDKNDATLRRHFSKIIDDFQVEVARRDTQIKQLIDEQLHQRKENKKLRNDLKEAKKHISQVTFQEKSIKLKEEQIKKEMKEIQELRESLKKDRERSPAICCQKHCTESCTSNLQLIEELQKDILRMTQQDKDKTIEIERLNSKINCLTRDLEGSSIKIDFLNSCVARCSQLNMPQGEEPLYFNEETPDTLTEDILKEVHLKLHELERESDELDVRFNQLKIK